MKYVLMAVKALVAFFSVPLGFIALLVLMATAVLAVVAAVIGVFIQSGYDRSLAFTTYVPPSTIAVAGIPADQLALFQKTAQESTCGLSWTFAAAVARQETNFGQNPGMYNPHDGGILGYGQFDPSAWNTYGNGGDIFSWRDGIPAIYRYLCALGAAKDPEHALWQYSGCVPGVVYNGRVCVRTDTYVRDAINLAYQYGLAATTTAGPSVNSIIEQARTFLGIPYVWGGTSRAGLDCSGLTYLVAQHFGVTIPRVAADQFNALPKVASSDLQVGDYVFFKETSGPGVTHVGIYSGNGMMLHAPEEGDVVREVSIDTPYWRSHYAGAGRLPVSSNMAGGVGGSV